MSDPFTDPQQNKVCYLSYCLDLYGCCEIRCFSRIFFEEALLTIIFKQEEEVDPHFEPVIRLTDQIEVKTHEEDEDVTFKMYAHLALYLV